MKDETKKWTPIKFSNEDRQEAEALIKALVHNAGLSEDFKDLINRYLQRHEDLEYFQTINTYLWATDMPDEVQDPEGLLFQIKFHEDE